MVPKKQPKNIYQYLDTGDPGALKQITKKQTKGKPLNPESIFAMQMLNAMNWICTENRWCQHKAPCGPQICD